jgi:hypothetical protein
VNQHSSIAAHYAVKHLTKISEALLAIVKEEQQQLLEHLQHLRFQPDGTELAMLDSVEPHQQELLKRHRQQQQQITPQLLEELLLLAAKREHYGVVMQLLEVRPAASEQLPSAAVAKLLVSVIRTKVKPRSALDVVLASLCELPAAAEISAGELASILRLAVDRRQTNSVVELCDLLFARAGFDSALALQVLMPVVRSSWAEGLGLMDSRGLLLVLQPQHTEQLLHQALLTATLAGAGMQPAWCDVPARSSSSSSDSSSAQEALPVELAVLTSLYTSDAGVNMDGDQEQRLQLTAAALGNAGALALLHELQGDDDFDPETVLSLLQCAVQFRSTAMIRLVEPLLCSPDMRIEIGRGLIREHALTSLLRTGDMTQLMKVAGELTATADSYAESKEQGDLLEVARQLGRCSSIRALCSKQSWWVVQGMQSQLSSKELQGMLTLAESENSASTVQCLLQQPVRADPPPDDFMQPVIQRQQQQQWPAWVDLDAAALLRAMQAGHMPDAAAHAMLQPATLSGEKLRQTPLPDSILFYNDVGVSAPQLLEAAVQMAPGQQQQAWLELLCRSQLVAYVNVIIHSSVHAQQYMSAVHAAYASGSRAALHMLCQALRQLQGSHLYLVVSAAVQVGNVPALRYLLLRWPSGGQLEASQVAALLRWTISGSSNSSSSSSASSTVNEGRVVYRHSCHPVTPSCSPATADMLRLLCEVPAAGQMAVYDMVGLLLYAMQQSDVEAVQQLCKLDAAAELDAVCVRVLLRWARVVGSRPGRDAVVGALAGLRGSRGLKASDVSKLLQLYDGADGLMGWSAAETEQAGVVPAEERLTCVL